MDQTEPFPRHLHFTFCILHLIKEVSLPKLLVRFFWCVWRRNDASKYRPLLVCELQEWKHWPTEFDENRPNRFLPKNPRHTTRELVDCDRNEIRGKPSSFNGLGSLKSIGRAVCDSSFRSKSLRLKHKRNQQQPILRAIAPSLRTQYKPPGQLWWP